MCAVLCYFIFFSILFKSIKNIHLDKHTKLTLWLIIDGMAHNMKNIDLT